MAHEALLFGMIEGASFRTEEYRHLQQLNAEVLAQLPIQDEWPWLVRGMFALPAPSPQGTFRQQVIHFGASIKDAPMDRSCWDVWIAKFERLLRKLWWWSASLVLQTDFEPDRHFLWIPAEAWTSRLSEESPPPVSDWTRSVVEIHHPASL